MTRRSACSQCPAPGTTCSSDGPVEAAPTKPGRPGTGTGYVALASARSRVPVFVPGGVTPERVPGLAAAGVRHFVVVRCLTEPEDPERSARALPAAIDANVPAESAV